MTGRPEGCLVTLATAAAGTQRTSHCCTGKRRRRPFFCEVGSSRGEKLGSKTPPQPLLQVYYTHQTTAAAAAETVGKTKTSSRVCQICCWGRGKKGKNGNLAEANDSIDENPALLDGLFGGKVAAASCGLFDRGIYHHHHHIAHFHAISTSDVTTRGDWFLPLNIRLRLDLTLLQTPNLSSPIAAIM